MQSTVFLARWRKFSSTKRTNILSSAHIRTLSVRWFAIYIQEGIQSGSNEKQVEKFAGVKHKDPKMPDFDIIALPQKSSHRTDTSHEFG